MDNFKKVTAWLSEGMPLNAKLTHARRYVMLLVWLLPVVGYIYKALINTLHLKRSGDEGFFLKELGRFQQDGMWTSFSDGISHLHVLLVNFLSYFVGQPLLAGRILSLLLLPLGFLIGVWIIRNLRLSHAVEVLTLATLAYVLVFSQSGKMFYRFLSDPLMIVIALGSILYIQRYCTEYRIKYLISAAILAGMMFWVRSFALLIFGGMFAFFLYLFIFHKPRVKHFSAMLLFITIASSTALIVQIPSIHNKGRISFEDKSGDGDWNERNWITRIDRKSNGGVFSYLRVTWDRVEQFKQEYGEHSIPRSLSERFARDPKFMVDSFVSNMVVRIPYVLLISIGFYFLLLLDLIRRPKWLFWDLQSSFKLLLLSVFVSVSLGLSLIIVNYIEHRWLFAAVFCALILSSMHLDRSVMRRYRKYLIGSQWIFLLLTGAAELIGLIII
ncbi:MAG: hypothetical protein Q8M98_11595 [Candidatus Cloacimonadaceae bacterium]|nr:hypothetical protein [Candidatus Cloacimonadaceae bacterium]